MLLNCHVLQNEWFLNGFQYTTIKFGNCDVWELTFDPLGGGPDVVVEVDMNSKETVKVIKENQVSGIEAVRSIDEDISDKDTTKLPRGWDGLKKIYSYNAP